MEAKETSSHVIMQGLEYLWMQCLGHNEKAVGVDCQEVLFYEYAILQAE